jgi:hypothetical protein
MEKPNATRHQFAVLRVRRPAVAGGDRDFQYGGVAVSNLLAWAVCGSISAYLVWGVPAHFRRLVAWAERTERGLVIDHLKEHDLDPYELLDRSKHLDRVYEELVEVQTCLKLGRIDVAKDRIDQLLFEMESS